MYLELHWGQSVKDTSAGPVAAIDAIADTNMDSDKSF